MAECRSGSLKLSIDGTNGFRKERGLSWKWREDLIRKFKGVRTAEFRKMREELKMFFIDAPNVQHGLEIRKIFLTELDLSQHQKTLAKKIEDTMAQRYKFQMPANHEKWYEIRWIEEQRSCYIHGASRTVEELRETVIKFDYNKVVAGPAKHDEAGEAESTDLTLPDPSGATGFANAIDPPSSHSAGSAQLSIVTAEQWPGEDDRNLAPTATSGVPSG